MYRVGELSSNTDKIVIGITSYQTKRKPTKTCLHTLFHLINRIIAVLSSEERGLFRERIRSLDKKIHPGLTKLTWASKGISDYFIGECRNNCSKVKGFQDTNHTLK